MSQFTMIALNTEVRLQHQSKCHVSFWSFFGEFNRRHILSPRLLKITVDWHVFCVRGTILSTASRNQPIGEDDSLEYRRAVGF